MAEMVWLVLLLLHFLGFDTSGLASLANTILPLLTGTSA